MISLEVSDKSNGRRGTELVFFSTSSVPECSKCIVTPGLGIALETIFELNCSYWDASVRQLRCSCDGDIYGEQLI